jgi:hypothetical protein
LAVLSWCHHPFPISLGSREFRPLFRCCQSYSNVYSDVFRNSHSLRASLQLSPPGTNGIAFFLWLCFFFLFSFLILGITLSVVDLTKAADQALSLWCACTDLILAISLLDAVTYPLVQPEDACCVNICKVGIVGYVCLFGGRMIWNGRLFFAVNRAYDWIRSPDEQSCLCGYSSSIS